MAYGFHDISGPWLAFRTQHRSPFTNPAQRFTQIAATADERNSIVGFQKVEFLIGRGQHFALVDVVDAHRFQDAGFGDVADAGFRHDGNADGVHHFLDDGGIRHPCNPAGCADIRGHALQSHDRHGTSRFGDPCLLRVHDIHDDAAFLHLGHPAFYFF